MKKFIAFFTLIFLANKTFAHEPWLLTPSQSEHFSKLPTPELFKTVGFFNVIILFLAVLGITSWIIINKYFFPPIIKPITATKQNFISLCLRIGLGSSLLLLSLGLITRKDLSLFTPSLLAPEFLMNNFFIYCQILISFCLLLGIFTRVASLVIMFLLATLFYQYNGMIFQYIGFFTGISFYLITQGSGKFALWPEKNKYVQTEIAFYVLQILTGLNFIYSAISIKLLHPAIDIGMLAVTQAFTFGIPYDYFTYLMFIVEASFGILILLGYRLRLIAILLLGLFIFLSINLNENLFAHNFIFGILAAFMIQNNLKPRQTASKDLFLQ